MSPVYSTQISLGARAIDFRLPGTDGREYALADFKRKKVLVIVFMCNHCKYVKATLQRFIDLQNQFADKSVQLVGINSNDPVTYPEDSFENMVSVAKEKNISFPYLLDETQAVAKKYQAVCTPDIYVYGEDRALLYQGRLDDNWQDEEQVTRRDLKEAIDRILAGRALTEEQIPSMGCSIKWKTN